MPGSSHYYSNDFGKSVGGDPSPDNRRLNKKARDIFSGSFLWIFACSLSKGFLQLFGELGGVGLLEDAYMCTIDIAD